MVLSCLGRDVHVFGPAVYQFAVVFHFRDEHDGCGRHRPISVNLEKKWTVFQLKNLSTYTLKDIPKVFSNGHFGLDTLFHKSLCFSDCSRKIAM